MRQRVTGCDRMITGENSSFVAEARHQADDPIIARFRTALQHIQTDELDRLYHRLPDLDECSRQAIRQFADCLIAKMLHPPLKSLRDEGCDRSKSRLLDALQQLFRLDA